MLRKIATADALLLQRQPAACQVEFISVMQIAEIHTRYRLVSRGFTG